MLLLLLLPLEEKYVDEDCRSTSPKCGGVSGKIPAVNFVKIHSENIAVSDTASLYWENIIFLEGIVRTRISLTKHCVSY